MHNLRNPKWLLIINTLPIVLVFFLFWSQFSIIKSLLEDSHIAYWKIFGSVLFVLGVLNLIYTLFLIIRKKQVSAIYGWIALLVYIPFIYLYGENADQIIPFSIPRWMLSGNILLYLGTFLMPTLFYSLLIIVLQFTPKDKKHNALINFAAAIAIPVCWYIFSQVITPLWQPVDHRFGIHILLIFIIIGTLLFLFFVVRGIYILAIKKGAAWKKYDLIWKIPIAIVFPILGLAINNGVLFNSYSITGSGIFGNFTSSWFYILAVINGILVCLPTIQDKTYQLLLFIGRSITFSYTLYFFMVFLPFLPLSVIAIVIVGAGFLMLAPLLLFVIHVQELVKNFNALKNQISINVLRGISVLSFLIIPICITIVYKMDRNTLEDTLDYVYSPDYSKTYSINTRSLQKTIQTIKEHKDDRNGAFLETHQTPYLSSFYNWIVLDNLLLSNPKIEAIEHIFFGTPQSKPRYDQLRNDQVAISDIQSKSIYDETQNVWKSWIHLEIKNDSSDRFKEYATTITLPDGCWISDYYLYVGDRKEMGLLAEKKSAMWVFSQIRNENKDPGILYYLTGNKVAFRVFPFTKNETRKTGIEFIHKEPVTLQIDGHTTTLGSEAQEKAYTNTNIGDLSYISSTSKSNLTSTKRKPYFHFLVDASIHKKKYVDDYNRRIQKLISNYPELSTQPKISFVNTYTSPSESVENWKKEFSKQSFEGGFYLDRAIKKTLFDSYQNPSDSYPVLVVVTDSIENAMLNKDFSDFKVAFPDHNRFYNLSDNAILEPYSLVENPTKKIVDSLPITFDQNVLIYKHKDLSVSYLPDDDKPSIILKNGPYTINEESISEKKWLDGLAMQGMWLSQTLFPEQGKKDWLQLVRNSFMSKIMSPVTSYLVVENEAQKAILKKKQEQVLAGNKNLDIGDDTARMSEPHLFVLLILLGMFIWYRKRRKDQTHLH
ncbi:MSEP-CTERM sorting domain-containing protein [Aquimarina litoralis]|uniref:MSEP-CTERM sorting domain-containing protein n=1 Tax=Aquimarina litoralis TaxID=584605 RepID=UPI001C592629|nr:MSEP-CTERM sorting domain-containing protein [Aquimarina litoralis]MBW1294927.1 MSEP-CTERM sorting domain-containing protein [Aquimarina litoralis]